MRNIVVPALAALSLAAVATPASAETVSVGIQIADLDLTTASGAEALEGRIRGAVARICRRAEVRKVADGADRQRCVEEATASARAEVARLTRGSPALALRG